MPRDVFYLGCLTQQKANRKEQCGAYDEIRDLMKKTISKTVEEGAKYAPERESKSARTKS